jgi:hypothetical protein
VVMHSVAGGGTSQFGNFLLPKFAFFSQFYFRAVKIVRK